MKKTGILLISAAAMLVFLLALLLIQEKKGWLYVIVKIITSSLCAAAGFFAYRKPGGGTLQRLIFIGLLFCDAGDTLLALSTILKEDLLFIGGVAAFETAQALFLIAFIKQDGFRPADIVFPLAGVAAVLLTQFLAPTIDLKELLVPVCVYAATIAFAAGKSGTILKHNKGQTWAKWLMAGAVLFALSDLELLFTIFSSEPVPFSTFLNHILYFPSLIFLVLGADMFSEKLSIRSDTNA